MAKYKSKYKKKTNKKQERNILWLRNRKIYEEWRISVYKRDNFTCQYCNDNKANNIEAHHIKSFAKYPNLRYDIDNGITLCKTCHKEIHKNKQEHML